MSVVSFVVRRMLHVVWKRRVVVRVEVRSSVCCSAGTREETTCRPEEERVSSACSVCRPCLHGHTSAQNVVVSACATKVNRPIPLSPTLIFPILCTNVSLSTLNHFPLFLLHSSLLHLLFSFLFEFLSIFFVFLTEPR